MSVEGDEWWEGALEEDTTWSLPLEGEGGLWESGFLPPPPRPAFLDDIQSDGLTTCDLCTWARAPEPGPHTLDSSSDLPGTLTWTISLVIVSVFSALLGAALMVTLMHCRRSQDDEPRLFRWLRRRRDTDRGREPELEADKEMATLHVVAGGGSGRGVWGWLTRRAPLAPPVPAVPAVNHYTMEEAYAAVGEALYAELDKPAYQNTGYVSESEPVSSAPSSAYYSDLSNSDRTYEAVGVGQTGLWDPAEAPVPLHQPQPRRPGPLTRHIHPHLAAITETLQVPSDYV